MYERYSPHIAQLSRKWGPVSSDVIWSWLITWQIHGDQFLEDAFPLGRPWHYLRVWACQGIERIDRVMAVDLEDILEGLF